MLSTMTLGTQRVYRRLHEEGPDKNPPSGALGVVGGGGKAVSSLPGLGAIVVWASLEEIAGYEAQWFNG